MSEPHSSAEGTYCLECYYDLRGLDSNRCPECGRPFDPRRSVTFSPLPHPTPVRDLFSRIGKALEVAFTPAPSPEETLRQLRIQTSSYADRIARMEQMNEVLRIHLDLVLDVLIQRGVMSDSELEQLRPVIEAATAKMGIVVSNEVAEGTEPDVPPTPELLELQRAVESRSNGRDVDR